jgi:hypothetical protein
MIRYQIFNQWEMGFLELFPDIFEVTKKLETWDIRHIGTCFYIQ